MKYILTTYSTTNIIDRKSLSAVEDYAKEIGAILRIIPYTPYGVTKPSVETTSYDIDEIEESSFIFNSLGIKGQAVNPFSGLVPIKNLIIPHPKIMFTPFSVNKELIYCLTTGCINDNTDYNNNKSGHKAKLNHQQGFIIVDSETNEFTQVTIKNHKFQVYGNTNKTPKALILGDLHPGYTNMDYLTKVLEEAKANKITTVYLHDVFDGQSVNHHMRAQKLTRSKLYKNLKEEMEDCGALLRWIKGYIPKIIIVRSNHDEFLDRWLDSSDFDGVNRLLTNELERYFLLGQNPLEQYIGKIPGVKWLKRDESSIIAGIEVGQHGDKGVNGSRGSALQFSKLYAKSITGHTHTPGRINDNVVVGTSTYMDCGYNVGDSTWANCYAVILNNGTIEMIIN